MGFKKKKKKMPTAPHFRRATEPSWELKACFKNYRLLRLANQLTEAGFASLKKCICEILYKLKAHTSWSKCFPLARSFTLTKWRKKGEFNLLHARDAAFHIFLYVWSESIKVHRKWVLFRDASNWNNVAILKINIAWSI